MRITHKANLNFAIFSVLMNQISSDTLNEAFPAIVREALTRMGYERITHQL